MKASIAAAFAALAFGAVQAVTIGWSGNQTGTYNLDYELGTAFAVTATFTIHSGSNSFDIFGVGATSTMSGAGANYIKVSKALNGNYGQFTFWAKGASGSEQKQHSGQNMNAVKQTVSLVIDTTGDTHTATFYLNGAKGSGAEFTFSTKLGAAPNLIQLFDNDYVSFESVAAYTADAGEDIYDLAQRSSEAGRVVPEPTALALLALGVAGMALRRRAA